MGREDHSTLQNKREHLNYEERKIIERLLKAGVKKSEIARMLLRNISTIKREIKRGSVIQRKRNHYESKDPNKAYIIKNVYFADVGQRVYEGNRANCGSRNKMAACSELVTYVEEKVLGKEKWSPDAAIGYAKANGFISGPTFSTKTFYNWVDDGLVKVKNIDLLLKVRRKPKNVRKQRKKILGKSIDERPLVATAREEFGHWEGDGIVGKQHKGHLITLVERKFGIGFLFNAGSRDDTRIVEIIDALEKQYGNHFSAIFKTITFDNGIEFSDSASMERNGRTDVYYAHPYSSFERGTNENWNGIVRRFIPKGSSFDKIDDDAIKRINHYINTLPRKRFGYKTPLDLWHEQLDVILAA